MKVINLQKKRNYYILFLIFVNLDFSLAALFSCINPLDVALSIFLIATFNFSLAVSLLPASTSLINFLIEVFVFDVITLLFSAFLALVITLFLALLIFLLQGASPYHSGLTRGVCGRGWCRKVFHLPRSLIGIKYRLPVSAAKP